MTRLTWNLARGALCAVSADRRVGRTAAAAPATVGTNTNLRQGPGTNFGVIMTVPGGSVVEVIRCGGEWCNVMARGRPGYMVARNLGVVGAAPVAVVGRAAGGGRRTRALLRLRTLLRTAPLLRAGLRLLRPAPLLAPLVTVPTL